MEEAKAKRAEEKRLAEQRVQEGKAGGGGDGVSRDEMHDPAHFFRLGLKMLLPPVRGLCSPVLSVLVSCKSAEAFGVCLWGLLLRGRARRGRA